jgi:hypothetical protein
MLQTVTDSEFCAVSESGRRYTTVEKYRATLRTQVVMHRERIDKAERWNAVTRPAAGPGVRYRLQHGAGASQHTAKSRW